MAGRGPGPQRPPRCSRPASSGLSTPRTLHSTHLRRRAPQLTACTPASGGAGSQAASLWGEASVTLQPVMPPAACDASCSPLTQGLWHLGGQPAACPWGQGSVGSVTQEVGLGPLRSAEVRSDPIQHQLSAQLACQADTLHQSPRG